MKTAGIQSWNLNQLLGTPGVEADLLYCNIELQATLIEDYQFTNTEVQDEADRLKRVGLTQRIIVERIGDRYVLIGPYLPYLALEYNAITTLSCIVRQGDIAQVQELLSIQLNSAYCSLSPLVYSRLITRLKRLYPVIKSVSGMSPGIKRSWIADILGLSSSGVLRYSYISKVPAAIQQRCNNPQFPYLCLRYTQRFTAEQFNQLLDELIHYELHSRYRAITATEFRVMIHNIAQPRLFDQYEDTEEPSIDTINDDDNSCTNASSIDNSALLQRPHSVHATEQLSALYEPISEQYYQNLLDSYDDRFEEDITSSGSFMHIAQSEGYIIPDQTLREVSYQLYCLSHLRLAGGQRTLNYAYLRSILESVHVLYNNIS